MPGHSCGCHASHDKFARSRRGPLYASRWAANPSVYVCGRDEDGNSYDCRRVDLKSDAAGLANTQNFAMPGFDGVEEVGFRGPEGMERMMEYMMAGDGVGAAAPAEAPAGCTTAPDGSLVTACPAGMVDGNCAKPTTTLQPGGTPTCSSGELINGKCYGPCEGNFQANGTQCLAPCPQGYTDNGTTCRVSGGPVQYVRPGYFTKSSCERANPSAAPGQDGCVRSGLFWRPKCKSGYVEGDFGDCVQECPEGWMPSSAGCVKPGIPRPTTESPACPSGQTFSNGACYVNPPEGYTCAGTNCVGPCPPGTTDNGVSCTPGPCPTQPAPQPVAGASFPGDAPAQMHTTYPRMMAAPGLARAAASKVGVPVPVAHLTQIPVVIREADGREGIFICKADLARFGMRGFQPDELDGSCAFFVPLGLINSLPLVTRDDNNTEYILFPPSLRPNGGATPVAPAGFGSAPRPMRDVIASKIPAGCNVRQWLQSCPAQQQPGMAQQQQQQPGMAQQQQQPGMAQQQQQQPGMAQQLQQPGMAQQQQQPGMAQQLQQQPGMAQQQQQPGVAQQLQQQPGMVQQQQQPGMAQQLQQQPGMVQQQQQQPGMAQQQPRPRMTTIPGGSRQPVPAIVPAIVPVNRGNTSTPLHALACQQNSDCRCMNGICRGSPSTVMVNKGSIRVRAITTPGAAPQTM